MPGPAGSEVAAEGGANSAAGRGAAGKAGGGGSLVKSQGRSEFVCPPLFVLGCFAGVKGYEVESALPLARALQRKTLASGATSA